MNFIHTLRQAARHALIHGLTLVVVALGRVLLGLQHALTWLDSEHPLAAWLKPVALGLHRHSLKLSAALAGLLLVGAGGAFAVSEYGPDAAKITVATLSEPIQIDSLQAQAQQLDLHELTLLRSDTTRPNDSPDRLLQRLGVTDPDAAQFLRKDTLVKLALGRAGRSVSLESNSRQLLQSMSIRWLRNESDNEFQRVTIARDAQGQLVSRLQAMPLAASVRMASGTVQRSLYDATDEARLPDTVVSQMAEAFSTQIDFHHAVRKGARFAVVYEVLEADGEPIRTGRLLSAEFLLAEKAYQAVWFEAPGQKGGYYSLDGKSLKRAYLAAPLTYSRKTSGLGVRIHPIFQTRMVHRGIDYAAPSGTPIMALGDGTVEFAGQQNGYGNVLVINHGNGHSTKYAHMSKIIAHKGQKVQQGQTVGLVGATGWATGPHLHFEFHVNGVFTDPSRVIAQSQAAPLPASARAAFGRVAQQAREKLLAATKMRDDSVQ